MSPENFAQQMTVLDETLPVIPLERLVRSLENGSPIQGAVVITFDDGYADALYEALPVLERNGMPATFFLPSAALGRDTEFWWDELDRVLLTPGTVSERLQLEVGHQQLTWDLSDAAAYSEQDAVRHRRWCVGAADPPTARHVAYKALWRRLQRVDDTVRASALAQMREWAGLDAGARRTHRTLSRDEAKRLASFSTVEIGAHTKTHPHLASSPARCQEAEIAGSKQDLEDLLEHEVRAFSYPYGGPTDYTQETVSLVRKAGYRSACGSFFAQLGSATNPYELPRLLVHDCTGDEFAERLSARLTARTV